MPVCQMPQCLSLFAYVSLCIPMYPYVSLCFRMLQNRLRRRKKSGRVTTNKRHKSLAIRRNRIPSRVVCPDGHFNFPHPWPDQIPPVPRQHGIGLLPGVRLLGKAARCFLQPIAFTGEHDEHGAVHRSRIVVVSAASPRYLSRSLMILFEVMSVLRRCL